MIVYPYEDWNYEYIYDWTLGKELNDPWPWNASVGHPPGFATAWAAKFAPWNHATRVCLWPHPFGGFAHVNEGGQHPLLQVRYILVLLFSVSFVYISM